MTRYGGLGIVMLSGLLVGCQPKPPEPPPQPPALGYDDIRSELIAGNPGAVVGEVGGTQLDTHLVLVDNVDPGALQLGDAVSFMDHRMNILTTGSVTEIRPDGNIIVRVEDPPAGTRAPEIGDVAVHIRLGATLNTAAPSPTVPGTVPGPTTMPALLPDMTNPAPPAPPAPPTPPAPPAPPATLPAAPAVPATQSGADMNPPTVPTPPPAVTPAPPSPAAPPAPPAPASTAPATEPAAEPATPPLPPPAPPVTQPELNK